MPPFEITEHTADLGLKATGATFAHVLAEAGAALFSVIAPRSAGADPTLPTVRFAVEADSPEELLHAWLDALNVRHQVEDVLFCDFDIEVEGNRLKATAKALPFDPRRDEPGVEVKAVTWHDLYVKETERGFEAFALLDI